MSIEQDLRARLTASLKAKDLATANVIRMINTKVMERRTAKGFDGEVDDKLFLEVIAAHHKSLAKARVQFVDAGDKGAEQVRELDFELAFLQQFLPQPLSEDEVKAAVAAAIAELGATDKKMAGRVMGAVMKAHKGVADAGMVKRAVDAALGG